MAFPVYGIAATEARDAVLDDTTDATQDTRLEAVLRAAIQQYEDLCGGKPLIASAGTRYYKYNAVHDFNYLRLDAELASLTTLNNGDADETSINTSDVVLLPRNTGPPYDEIFWPDGNGFQIAGDAYWIKVVGTWGYNATVLLANQKEVLLSFLKYKWNIGEEEAETITGPSGEEFQVRRGIPSDVILAAKSDRRLVNWSKQRS